MKKLIPAIVLLLVSAIVMSTASYAWFSMNRTVEAVNMQVKATAGASLVITNKADKSFTAGTVSVEESAIDITVMPATKFTSGVESASGTSLASSDSDLMFVNNGGNIDPATGKALAGKTLYYSAATTASVAASGGNPGTVGYYYDFVFYLAAEGNEDIQDGTLYVTIPKVTLTFDPAEDILKATSVLVYVDDTLKTSSPILLKDGATDIELDTLSSTNKIVKGAPGPVALAKKITLRVYVDGALEKDTDKNYVRNEAIVDFSRAASFNAKFEVK